MPGEKEDSTGNCNSVPAASVSPAIYSVRSYANVVSNNNNFLGRSLSMSDLTR